MNTKEKLEQLLDEILTSDPHQSASKAEEAYNLYVDLRANESAKCRRNENIEEPRCF